MSITVSPVLRRPEVKKKDRSLGNGLKVTEEDDSGLENVRYTELALSITVFTDGLAAILSKEIPARSDDIGKLLVMDGSGNPIYVEGTREATLRYAKAMIRAIGQYPRVHADEIVRRSFTKLMALTATHHFDTAVGMLVEYHPSHLRPSEDELRRAEDVARQRAAKKRRDAEADLVRKKARIATPPAGETPRGGAKKLKIDASCQPCHGMAYHGVCKKQDCPFDHDDSRCKAFKEANPSGPPART